MSDNWPCSNCGVRYGHAEGCGVVDPDDGTLPEQVRPMSDQPLSERVPHLDGCPTGIDDGACKCNAELRSEIATLAAEREELKATCDAGVRVAIKANELAARVEALVTANRKWKRYARHSIGCKRNKWEAGWTEVGCSCGLAAWQEEVRAAEERESDLAALAALDTAQGEP